MHFFCPGGSEKTSSLSDLCCWKLVKVGSVPEGALPTCFIYFAYYKETTKTIYNTPTTMATRF